MPRILLLVPTATYRASDFVAAATRLGVDVVIGSEHRQALARHMGDRAVVVPLHSVDAAVVAIAALHERTPLDAVLAVDDQGVVIAAPAPARAPGSTPTGFQDRAGVDTRHIPGFALTDAASVAEAGLAALARNQVLCTPGLANWLARLGSRLAPRTVVRRMAGQVLRRM
jgi:hypothetical protein